MKEWIFHAKIRTLESIVKALDGEADFDGTHLKCPVCACVKRQYHIQFCGDPFSRKENGMCQDENNKWCPARTLCKEFSRIVDNGFRSENVRLHVSRLQRHLKKLEELSED